MPQDPELPSLWTLDKKKAHELEGFAEKWGMEDLQKEFVDFLGIRRRPRMLEVALMPNAGNLVVWK
jgi:hypothetical protein